MRIRSELGKPTVGRVGRWKIITKVFGSEISRIAGVAVNDGTRET